MLSKKASVPQGRSGGHWSRAESSPSWERRAAGVPLSAHFEVSAADSRACGKEQPMYLCLLQSTKLLGGFYFILFSPFPCYYHHAKIDKKTQEAITVKTLIP